jgi:ParB family transcriptional regulator, chromosome partitioning protein
MARKNLLTSITDPGGSADAHETRADYALRGASRSMKLSIDELAESAKKIVAGETVIELDPALVDPSPVKDRIDDDQEEFALFRDGIEERGQLQPILVRPNPQASGR